MIRTLILALILLASAAHAKTVTPLVEGQIVRVKKCQPKELRRWCGKKGMIIRVIHPSCNPYDNSQCDPYQYEIKLYITERNEPVVLNDWELE